VLTQRAAILDAMGLMHLQANAACRDSDPDMFFAAGREEEAVAVCRRCPVRAECLDYALVARMDAGVWGGTTEGQRAELVALARRARSGKALT
jgi:WhiB family redox-sensing transcriptional regulator